MPTDMYGAVEIYRLAPHDDPADTEPWTRAMDLYPLYRGSDYLAFGCLSGVRNWAGGVSRRWVRHRQERLTAAGRRGTSGSSFKR